MSAEKSTEDEEEVSVERTTAEFERGEEEEEIDE